MKREELLKRVKIAIQEVEPQADIILYGSQSRGEARAESDWNFLVLIDGPVDDDRTDTIRHKLYEIEWEYNEILSSIVRNRQEWRSQRYCNMPIHQQIEQDGIVL